MNMVLGTTWINSVSQEIIRLNPHQVTMVTNDPKTVDAKENAREITRVIPTVLLNLIQMRIAAETTSVTQHTFVKSSKTAFYLIFYDADINSEEISLENLQHFFYYLSKLSPRIMRPKCLIIIFSKNLIFEKSLEAALYYAWTMKFLDVTILTVIKEHGLGEIQPIIYYYNPFFKEFYSGICMGF